MLQTQENLTNATDVGSDVPPEKKKKTKLKVKFQKLLTRKKKEDIALASAADSGADESEAAEEPPQPPATPKKKREKKPKKEKPESKKGHRLIIGLCIGAVLVGVTAAVVLVMVSGGSSVEKQLERAANYTDKEQYDKAESIYNDLLIQDVNLVLAYVGYTENYLAQGDEEGAITILERGYLVTEDSTIGAMLDRLRPMDEEDEEPQGPSQVPIVWQDVALEQMVRRAMPELGSGPITEEDLQRVTTLKIVGGTHVTTGADMDNIIRNLNRAEGYTIDGELYTERGNIRSLADIAHFKNLKKLVIGYNQISDLGGIEYLDNLETLGLYCNNISDIHLLSGLSNLKYLYLYHNSISDISALGGLSALQSVYLQNNLISDLSPLGNNPNLIHLYISDNQLTDISTVRSLSNLAIFMAEDNAIGDLSPVEDLSNLTDVNFSGNPAADYSPTVHIQNVNKVY